MRVQRNRTGLRIEKRLDFAENLIRHFFLKVVAPGQAFAADLRAPFFPTDPCRAMTAKAPMCFSISRRSRYLLM